MRDRQKLFLSHSHSGLTELLLSLNQDREYYWEKIVKIILFSLRQVGCEIRWNIHWGDILLEIELWKLGELICIDVEVQVVDKMTKGKHGLKREGRDPR